MACPFFCPTERADDLAFPHPARLPLGAAWRGFCQAPGHEPSKLSGQELESCNLGYAKACPRLPKDRVADAVRFAVMSESESRLAVQFVFESAHVPAGRGSLEYDRMMGSWSSLHSDPRVQKLAESFLQSYLARKSH